MTALHWLMKMKVKKLRKQSENTKETEEKVLAGTS